MLEYFLSSGADINRHREGGETPLLTASLGLHWDIETFELMLAAGADVNKATSSGETPLHRAALRGGFEVCKLFIERGADVCRANKRGETAAQLVIERETTNKELYMYLKGLEDEQVKQSLLFKRARTEDVGEEPDKNDDGDVADNAETTATTNTADDENDKHDKL